MELKSSASLLQPLPILERPRESISMNFIIGLPKSDGFASIIIFLIDFPSMEPSFQQLKSGYFENNSFIPYTCGERLGSADDLRVNFG